MGNLVHLLRLILNLISKEEKNKKVEKVLDKLKMMWYNKDVERLRDKLKTLKQKYLVSGGNGIHGTAK